MPVQRYVFARSLPCLAALIGAVVLAVAAAGSATECYSPSPSFADNRTPFDEMMVRPLTPSEKKAVLALFASLSGRWAGHEETLTCIGREGAYTVEERVSTVTAEVQTDRRTSLSLLLKMRDNVRRTNTSQRIRLFVDDRHLRYGATGAEGDVELVEVAAEGVSFLQRRRGGPGTINHETFIVLEAGKGRLCLEKTVYTQGKFTAHSMLRLMR